MDFLFKPGKSVVVFVGYVHAFPNSHRIFWAQLSGQEIAIFRMRLT